MDAVRSAVMRWKTACRWSKDPIPRDGGLQPNEYRTSPENGDLIVVIATPCNQFFLLTFPKSFPAAPCVVTSHDSYRYMDSFTKTATEAVKDMKDVIPILDAVAAKYVNSKNDIAIAETTYVESPLDDDSADGPDAMADESFIYDMAEDDPIQGSIRDHIVRQTTAVFDATQLGALSEKAAKILTKEYNAIKKAEPGSLPFHVEPQTESDIGRWIIALTDFGDSLLAKQMAQGKVPSILIQACFPNDYPNTPPLLRIIGPRLKYLTGNVTFSGVVCLPELSSALWVSARPLSVIEMVALVRSLLLEHDARLDIRSRRGYTDEEVEATIFTREQSCTEYKRPFRHLSAQKLFAIRNEKKNVGNRVELPGSMFERLARDLSASLPPVLVFMVETLNHRTFVGVDNFNSPEGIIHMPLWMMEGMHIHDGQEVNIRLVSLPKLEFVKFKPLEFELVAILEESRKQGIFGTAACPLVRAIGTYFVPFTRGDTIQITVEGKNYHLFILQTKPAFTAIIPQDGEYHDLKIEFTTAVDMDTAAEAMEELARQEKEKQEAEAHAQAAAAAEQQKAAKEKAEKEVKQKSLAADPTAAIETHMCALCGKDIPLMSMVLHQSRCNGKGAEIEIAQRKLKAEEDAREAERKRQEAERERENQRKAEEARQAEAQAALERELRKQAEEKKRHEEEELRQRRELERLLSQREQEKRGVSPTSPPPASRTGGGGGGRVNANAAAPCQYYWNGHCREGKNCMFSHGSEPTAGTTGGSTNDTVPPPPLPPASGHRGIGRIVGAVGGAVGGAVSAVGGYIRGKPATTTNSSTTTSPPPPSGGGQRSKGGSGRACMYFMAGSCRNGVNCTDEHYQGK